MLRGVLGRVIAAPFGVDRASHGDVLAELLDDVGRGRFGEDVMDDPRVVDLGIGHLQRRRADRDDAGVAELAAALGIEQRAIEHERRLVAVLGERGAGSDERREVRIGPVELLCHVSDPAALDADPWVSLS